MTQEDKMWLLRSVINDTVAFGRGLDLPELAQFIEVGRDKLKHEMVPTAREALEETLRQLEQVYQERSLN